MAHIEFNLWVSKPVENIYSFLNNPESHREFIPRCIEFRQTSDGEFGQVGGRIKGMLNYFGIRIPVDYEIIENTKNKSIAMSGRMGPVAFKDGYVISSRDNGTNILFWLELAPTSWAKVFIPFSGLIGKIHAWETLRNMNRVISAL